MRFGDNTLFFDKKRSPTWGNRLDYHTTLGYSPDLNPIEKMWSKIKSILRTLKARKKDTLICAIAKALEKVTASDAKRWFKACGYTNKIN